MKVHEDCLFDWIKQSFLDYRKTDVVKCPNCKTAYSIYDEADTEQVHGSVPEVGPSGSERDYLHNLLFLRLRAKRHQDYYQGCSLWVLLRTTVKRMRRTRHGTTSDNKNLVYVHSALIILLAFV